MLANPSLLIVHKVLWSLRIFKKKYFRDGCCGNVLSNTFYRHNIGIDKRELSSNAYSILQQLPGSGLTWGYITNADITTMGITMASQITSLTSVHSTVYSGVDQSSALPAFVRGIHRRPVNSPHKRPVKGKMFPFDDVIMWTSQISTTKTLWCVSTDN